MNAVTLDMRALNRISKRIPKAWGPDRYAFSREISRIRQALGKGRVTTKLEAGFDALSERIEASINKRRERVERRPRLDNFPDLPITAKKDDIIRAIRENSVVIIAGETGSGKTTQIPKFCLAAGRGIDGIIGCTQPRRIAAISVAARISEELGETPGESVGYKVRFQENAGTGSYIKIMTDGILLAETQGDRYLNAYDTLIVDEAHERSLNIDFILGILKTLLNKRRDLKVIITSATIDTEKFSKAFDNAPIIEVSGRTYPVEVRYDPLPEDEDLTHVEKAALAVDRLIAESRRGDILLFMPTEGDIRETIELIEGRNHRGVNVLPLFARLSAADQGRVFANTVGRKIIVATNIAETSLTIPGIKYVVDTGLARIAQYNPRSRTTGLPVAAISRSSADQRMGRCGRVENGICVRLYSEEDYQRRPLYTRPEILRANLAEVILRMISLNLGDIEQFPFLDMPPDASIQDGFNLLQEIGAITPTRDKSGGGYSLTRKGRMMAQMPIDPRLSCILIEAGVQGCLREMLVIAAALSIQDPRERPAEKAAEADRAHAAFKDPDSDFVMLLNIWNRCHEVAGKQFKIRELRKFSKTSFVSFRRMREWRDIHAQLSGITEDPDMTVVLSSNETPVASGVQREREFSPLYEKIHKSLLSGFLSNIAMKKEGNLYQAGKGRQAMIFPGSGLFNRSKSWIVSAEMVETSRLYARTAAHIDPDWIEGIAGDRCKYSYLHPHWERNRGNVVATEQVSLFGLVIVADRTVLYGRINPEEASDIFIQSALVAGDVKKSLPFMAQNRKAIETVQNLEDKIRRRDLLISETDLFHFYKERLGGIYDIRTLERRIRERGGHEFLLLKEEDLLRYAPDRDELAQYPDRIQINQKAFPCEYRFEPGSADDGITVRIPVTKTDVVSPEALDWLVPGLFREKIAALIKSLPKLYRKQLVPVTDTVDIIVAEMEKSEEGLLQALGTFIYRRFGVDIPARAWAEDQLPDHLRMRIAITDRNGREIAADRNKSILFRELQPTDESTGLEVLKKDWEKTGLTRWDFGDLPEELVLKEKSGREWIVFPALVPDETGARHVNLRLYPQKREAMEIHRAGVHLLYSLHLEKDIKLLRKMISIPKASFPMAAYFGGEKTIQTQIIDSIANELFSKDIRTQAAFFEHAAEVTSGIVAIAQQRLDGFLPVLEAVHDIRSNLFYMETLGKGNRHVAPLIQEIRNELECLIPLNAIALYAGEKMARLPRLIRALGIRAARAIENPERDRQRADMVLKYKDCLNRIIASLTPASSETKQLAVEEFFWMLEEYKVSLFAQELKTLIPISAKRLDKKVEEIERML